MTTVATRHRRGRVRVPQVDVGGLDEEVRGEIDAAWRTSVDRSAFIGGEAVKAFEAAWAERCGRRFAVGVANGTDAIALSLRAIGLGPGDEVIVPANTFIATAEAVVMAGATPRFIDVEERTHLVDPAMVAPMIDRRTRAIIAVDLHGNVPDMDGLAALADVHGLALIEDAAQAHGAMRAGRPAGSFGVASCFSFYPAKNLGAFGDAGAVVTDDEKIAERIRSMANHGRSAVSATTHVVAGVNSRLDAIQAAVLSAKLKRLATWNGRRREIARSYDDAFGRLGRDALPLRPPNGTVGVYHHYVIRSPWRERMRAELSAAGIETAVHYPNPCHLQEPFRPLVPRRLPVAERLASEILSLPMFPHMTDEQIELVCDAVTRTAEGKRARR